MKFLIPLLFAVPAFAMDCADSSSGLIASVQKDSKNIYFHFRSARGYDSIPQIDGPVAPVNFPMMKFQVDSLRGLGETFDISLPLSACDLARSKEGIFTCYGEGEISGTGLKFSSLTGFRVKQSHASGDFEYQNFRLMIGKEDRFFFTIPFPGKSCVGNL